MSLHIAQRIVAATPMFSRVDRVEYLSRGYSTDEKYVLWEGDGPSYLLRLSDIEHRGRRQADFDLITTHHRRGVSCPKPHLFGVTEDGEACYAVFSYVEGRDGEEALPMLPEGEQFEIGVSAGKELRRMHQLRYPEDESVWPAHRRAKHLRYRTQAAELGLAFEGQGDVEKYVEANLGLLDSAAVRFQHDDFHPANLIVDGGRLAGIIDFNRCDWGDPVEDFYKVPWFTVPVSVPFARGQVRGYLSAGVPEDFWKRYNLYVAMSTYSSLVWSSIYYPQDLESFRGKTRDILETHDFINGGPPVWYGE